MRFSQLWERLARGIARAAGKEELLTRLRELERKIDLLEYLSHGARATYVGNNRILVKCVVAHANIAYLVEADDRLITPWFIVTGAYETELTNFFLSALRPDSHCIDVGANFGYFTCLTARFCPQGRIVGIEADRHVYEIARDNVFINGFQNFARVIHAAASDSDGMLTLHRRATRSANTSVAMLSPDYIESMGEAASEAFDVPSLKIDNLLAEFDGRVDFMKIDVEGAEPLVLRGARETILQNPNLKIIMEWSPGQIRAAGFDVADVLTLLNELNLEAFDISSGSLLPLPIDALAVLDYRAGIVLKRA